MRVIHLVSPNTKTLCLLTLISDTLIKSFEVQWTEFSNFSYVSMATGKQPVPKLLYSLLNANLGNLCNLAYLTLPSAECEGLK